AAQPWLARPRTVAGEEGTTAQAANPDSTSILTFHFVPLRDRDRLAEYADLRVSSESQVIAQVIMVGRPGDHGRAAGRSWSGGRVSRTRPRANVAGRPGDQYT